MTVLISFYTEDWLYPYYAMSLKKDCEDLKIPHIIEKLPTTGSYLKNTCMKPQFILDKLKELKKPVLWVDCDGSVLRPPIFSTNFDFAAKRKAKSSGRTWHVGTMWFNYTPAMIKFIEEWIKNTGGISDESSLEKTWKDIGSSITTMDVPKDYFVILKKGQKPHGTICHRISDGPSKRKELPVALLKNKRGFY